MHKFLTKKLKIINIYIKKQIIKNNKLNHVKVVSKFQSLQLQIK